MERAKPVAVAVPDRPVLPWRWVAGVLLHVAVVAYLLVVPLGCLLLSPSHTSTEDAARLVLRLSLWFVAGLAVTMLIAVSVAALVNRGVSARRRRLVEPSSPAEASKVRVERVLRTNLDEASAAPLARIAALRWDHEDARYQSLARDLDEVMRAAATALASASRERRPVIAMTQAQTLTRIADVLEVLGTATASADEAQVQLLSNYVRARYPTLDSPFGAD